MANKGNTSNEQADDTISAVDFTNQFNEHLPDFRVDLSMQVTQKPGVSEVVAGIEIDMGGEGPAFIPSDILRLLADEADAMAQKAINDANGRRGR
jgi:hypothetical protein